MTNKAWKETFPIYQKLEKDKEVMKKFHMFVRPNTAKYNRLSMTICGLTLGFVRCMCFVFSTLGCIYTIKIVLGNFDSS